MRKRVVIALLVLGGLAAVFIRWARAVPALAPPPEAPPAALPAPEALAPSGPLAELRWVLGGSRVLVDQRWLWDPDGGTFTPLPYPTVRPVEGGGEEWLSLALSRDGARVAVWDAHAFHVGPVDGALTGPFPLPFAEVPGEADGVTRSQVMFWNGRDELLFADQRFDAEVHSACARFEPAARTWRRVKTCPEGTFLRLAQVDPGPGDWVAVVSSAEGVGGFQLTRYADGTRPPEGPPPLDFELYPEGDVRTAFARDGTRLLLTTPCALERAERPCEGVEDGAPWRLYTWSLAGRRLTREREDVPARAVVSPESPASPEGGRFAWPLPGRVCVSEGKALDVARCQPLPPVPRDEAPQRAE